MNGVASRWLSWKSNGRPEAAKGGGGGGGKGQKHRTQQSTSVISSNSSRDSRYAQWLISQEIIRPAPSLPPATSADERDSTIQSPPWRAEGGRMTVMLVLDAGGKTASSCL